MVDVEQRKGGASPRKPMIGSKSSQPEKPNNSNSEDGSGGMVVVVGREKGGGDERTQADTRLDGFITGKGQIHRFI